MPKGNIVEGIFALHKPEGKTSAQCLRELQDSFTSSKLFQPWIKAEQAVRSREVPNQRNRRKIKNLQVKIGHGGTLDPMATGVLIAGVGKGTKALSHFLNCTKTYETVVLFGAMTDTYDRTGKVLKRGPHDHLTKGMVEQALAAFRGKIMQRPPIFSALKMNGKPLYEYAREGKEIPREIVKRPVEVIEVELLAWMEGGTHDYTLPEDEASEAEKRIGDVFQASSWEDITGKAQSPSEHAGGKKRKADETDDLVSDVPSPKKRSPAGNEALMSGGLQTAPVGGGSKGPPAAKFRLTVTSGFYIRSFAFDLGQAVKSQALMSELVRTRQGNFELGKNVIEWGVLMDEEAVWAPQVEALLDEWHDSSNASSAVNAVDPVVTATVKEEAKEECIAGQEQKEPAAVEENAKEVVDSLDVPVIGQTSASTSS